MRTTVIPAQITTVEDKIAGNLNLTQILILMVPVFWTTAVYVLFPPKLHLAWYKLPLAILVLLLSLILSLRIKDKVVLNWLFVIFKFNLRPKFYIFNKNDQYLRDLDLPVFEKRSLKLFRKNEAKKEIKQSNPNFSIKDLIQLENLFTDPKYAFSFKLSKKGGLNVAFKQIQN